MGFLIIAPHLLGLVPSTLIGSTILPFPMWWENQLGCYLKSESLNQKTMFSAREARFLAVAYAFWPELCCLRTQNQWQSRVDFGSRSSIRMLTLDSVEVANRSRFASGDFLVVLLSMINIRTAKHHQAPRSFARDLCTLKVTSWQAGTLIKSVLFLNCVYAVVLV